MTHLSRSIAVLVVLAATLTAAAGDPSFTVTTDKPDATYAVDQPITFSITVMQDGKPVEGAGIKWVRVGDDGQKQEGQLASAAKPVTLDTSMTKPGFVRLVLTLLDETGKPAKNAAGRQINFNGGAAVAPDKLATAPEPDDFDAFWQQQKQALAAVPMKADLTPVPAKNQTLIAFDVKVDCAGGKPVSGYLVKPKDAKPKSLVAVVGFHGYGVRSASQDERPGQISFNVNAHGIENGKPAEFYQALRDGELNRYGFTGNETPQSSYFLGMYMRVMRALEFVKSQPEWDGRNLIVIGGSQGGMQALAAAGLDHQVNLCVASKPWCCDLDGITLGRQRGWRPDPAEGLRYFDPAHHAKRIKAYVLADAGMGDYTCPPSSVTAMFNNIPGNRKQLIYIQGATHGRNPRGERTCWSQFGKVLAEVTKQN